MRIHGTNHRFQPEIWMLVLLVLLVWATSSVAFSQSESGFELLGRGVNYGNMLEAPNGDDRGSRFDDADPQLIKSGGFDHVRIPFRWSSHLEDEHAIQIEPSFLNRRQHIVKSLSRLGSKSLMDSMRSNRYQMYSRSLSTITFLLMAVPIERKPLS